MNKKPNKSCRKVRSNFKNVKSTYILTFEKLQKMELTKGFKFKILNIIKSKLLLNLLYYCN